MTGRRARITVVAACAALTLAASEKGAPPCAPDDGGLSLAEGLCASVFASDLGAVRQLEAGPDGVVYAAVRGASGGIVALRDADGDGRAEVRRAIAGAGGNDVALRGQWLYFAENDRVVRYRLAADRLSAAGEPEVVVRDLPAEGGHTAKSIAFGPDDELFVNIGSRSNSCQRDDRRSRSPGIDPCVELERRAGIWVFEADRIGQRFAPDQRYATGLRNASALEVHPRSGTLFAAIHGRDQLAENWGFSAERNANDPAEELVLVDRGDDFGWPYCYYSNEHRKKVLAPEYGGDGAEVGRCSAAKDPLIAFPGHWGPLAIAFYPARGSLGAEYSGGALIAFHGSWNRAPLEQEGYRVVFAPFKGDRPTGEHRTFAIGRAGPTAIRPSGVAVGPDGAVFIADDRSGTIWRVTKR